MHYKMWKLNSNYCALPELNMWVGVVFTSCSKLRENKNYFVWRLMKQPLNNGFTPP